MPLPCARSTWKPSSLSAVSVQASVMLVPEAPAVSPVGPLGGSGATAPFRIVNESRVTPAESRNTASRRPSKTSSTIDPRLLSETTIAG